MIIRLPGITLTVSWSAPWSWTEVVHRLHGGRFCRVGWHNRATLGNDRVCLWCLDSRPK